MKPKFEPYKETGYQFVGHYDGRDLYVGRSKHDEDPLGVLYCDGTPYPPGFCVNGRYIPRLHGKTPCVKNCTRELYDFAVAIYNLQA